MELDVALLRSLTMTDGTASNNSLLNAGGSCPNLESLKVTVCSFVGDRDACLDGLITMLKSRAKIMASFKTICCNESMDKYDANDIHKQLLDPLRHMFGCRGRIQILMGSTEILCIVFLYIFFSN